VGNSRLIKVTDFLTVYGAILSPIFVSLFDCIAPSCYIFLFIVFETSVFMTFISIVIMKIEGASFRLIEVELSDIRLEL